MHLAMEVLAENGYKSNANYEYRAIYIKNSSVEDRIKIDYSIIADNAAGYFMKNRDINLAIVGADRIAANGDFANKIGTYEKAVLAKVNNIPFYVAAPGYMPGL